MKAIYYDISDVENTLYLMKNLQNLFADKKIEIRIFSPSNCYDYDASAPIMDRRDGKPFLPKENLLKSAKVLCGESKPIVLFSMHSAVFNSELLHQYALSLDGYAKKLSIYTKLENQIRENFKKFPGGKMPTSMVEHIYDTELPLFNCKEDNELKYYGKREYQFFIKNLENKSDNPLYGDYTAYPILDLKPEKIRIKKDSEKSPVFHFFTKQDFRSYSQVNRESARQVKEFIESTKIENITSDLNGLKIK